MTIEEAIRWFEKSPFMHKDHEPFKMAIEALKKQLKAEQTEPQYDFGEYADRLWKIAYERGKREALEQTEPSCDTCKLKDTTEWCKRQEVCRAYQPKDEPQTERLCDKCEYYKSGEICGHPSIGDPDMGGRGDTFSWIKETPEWCPLKPQTERSE